MKIITKREINYIVYTAHYNLCFGLLHEIKYIEHNSAYILRLHLKDAIQICIFYERLIRNRNIHSIRDTGTSLAVQVLAFDNVNLKTWSRYLERLDEEFIKRSGTWETYGLSPF